MKFVDNVVCPISSKKIDGNLDRLSVFLIVLLLSVYLLAGNPLFLILVVFDYTIRAFDKRKYSPTKLLATFLNKFIKIPPKLIDQAPKLFASRIGLLNSGIALIFYLIGLTVPSVIASSVLLTFTILDSIFNICAGCLIYNYLVFPFYKRKFNI